MRSAPQTRRPRGPFRTLAIGVLTAAWAWGSAGAGEDRLGIHVLSSDGTVPSELRTEVEGMLAVDLGTKRCVSAQVDVGRRLDAGSAETLRLELDLTELEQELSHDRSLAEHAGSRDPSVARQMTASFGVQVRWTLTRVDEVEPLATRSFHVKRTLRPRIPGEDAAATAREQATAAVVEQVTRGLCRSAVRKRIERGRLAR